RFVPLGNQVVHIHLFYLSKVGARTETELKERKLRVEDALNATKAAVEEGIVVGGGCTLLRLSSKVDAIKETLENEEQKFGADIVKRALTYPLDLIAKNAGVNGVVVTEKVLSNDNPSFGYNAATGKYEDLMAAGIIDPTKVVRCCLENSASVAKTFLTSDAVVIEIRSSSLCLLQTQWTTQVIDTKISVKLNHEV
ncbi:ruBisCO large subunit-binding protein subunit beta, chloroplastic-like, partial [Silene latifolia]|uniref:ruBisCO large subunit-binding protein subunit beta, chloroplastic-like n=1 Tax=Silene latifolia TaxID=37657 RepID=UPI003D771EF4